MKLHAPQVTGLSDRDRWEHLYSYLTEMTEELNRAYTETERKAEAVTVAVPQKEQTASEVFTTIKDMIIRSADIVEAYSDKIREKLSGVYVAQSQFGTYSERTDLTVTKQSTDIEEQFSMIASVRDELDTVRVALQKTDAYIRRGLLGYDEHGQPFYGMEVGESTTDGFRKYARFTSSRLSFFDGNGTEIAYISDSTLHITEAEIEGNLRIGGYTADSSSGLAFLWTR